MQNSDQIIESVKQKLFKYYINENSSEVKYNDKDLLKASSEIISFLHKVSNMKVYDDENVRNLNNLEMFIAIYEFVSNRIYIEQETSHDLIGALITNKSVCQGYCQLMEFLCKTLNVPFLYKRVETFNENNLPLGSHGNFEVIVKDFNGFSHCLHCDPTIDSPKDEFDVLGFNALLIQDNDINKYYHKQVSSGGDISSFYENFLSKEQFEQSIAVLYEVKPIELILSGKSEEEIIDDHFIKLKESLIQLNKFFNMNIDFRNLNNSQLISIYQSMYEYYVSISHPINPDELKSAILNVKTAEIMYEKRIDYEEAKLQSQEIFEQRMKKSIDLQTKCWDNEGGVSLIFDEVNRINCQTK